MSPYEAKPVDKSRESARFSSLNANRASFNAFEFTGVKTLLSSIVMNVMWTFFNLVSQPVRSVPGAGFGGEGQSGKCLD